MPGFLAVTHRDDVADWPRVRHHGQEVTRQEWAAIAVSDDPGGMTIDEGPAVFVSIGGQVMLLPRGVLLAMHGWATPWRPWVRAAPTCSSG